MYCLSFRSLCFVECCSDPNYFPPHPLKDFEPRAYATINALTWKRLSLSLSVSISPLSSDWEVSVGSLGPDCCFQFSGFYFRDILTPGFLWSCFVVSAFFFQCPICLFTQCKSFVTYPWAELVSLSWLLWFESHPGLPQPVCTVCPFSLGPVFLLCWLVLDMVGSGDSASCFIPLKSVGVFCSGMGVNLGQILYTALPVVVSIWNVF